MPKGNPGSKHHKWNSGIGFHCCGYIKVRVGKTHPVADRNGWAYLHRLVWWSAGNQIPKGFVVHHVNGDKEDNRIENLAVVSRSDHNRHHNKEKAINPLTGRFVSARAAGREWSEFPEVAR